MGLQIPRVDFRALAGEVATIESQYAGAGQAVERIGDPRILCAASEQYSEPAFGFDRDVAILERAFPGRIEVERGLTRAKPRRLLTNRRFEIVHLVLPVDAGTGEMIFSRADLSLEHPRAAPHSETLAPSGFADLLLESGTRLVVMATCDALLLAVEVHGAANMAASDTLISADAAIEWEDSFYSLLSEGKSVYKAFELAKSLTKAPMRHIGHRDVVFGAVDG